MWRVIRVILTGDFHPHKWKILSERDVVFKRGDMPHATKYVLQCEHCGAIKKTKV